MASRWFQRRAVVLALALGCCLFALPGLVSPAQAQGALCSTGPFPQCGGACPTGQTCAGNTVTRQCECVSIPCQQSAPPTCGGTCPSGSVCQPDATGVCACGPVACQQTAFPQCGGSCPAGSVCQGS